MDCYRHNRDHSESAYFPEIWNGNQSNSCTEEEGYEFKSSAASFDAVQDAHPPVEFRSATMHNLQPSALPMTFTSAERHCRSQSLYTTMKEDVPEKEEVFYELMHERCGVKSVDDAHLNESDVTVKYNTWRITMASVSKLPCYYPLEQTHVVISLAIMPLDLIAALVCLLCRKLSLAAEFHQDVATVALTASDGTHFIVKIFHQVDGKSVVLECQKLSGDSETFYSNAFKLLQVSKGLEHVKSIKSGQKSRHTTSPAFVPKAEDAQTTVQEMRTMVHDHLEMAAELLEKDRQDANDLGLETFIYMTDSQSSALFVLRETSLAVLRGFILLDRDDSAEMRVVPLNIEYLFGPMLRSTFHNYQGEGTGMGIQNSGYDIWKRLMAWKILTNALHACFCCGIALKDLADGSPYNPWILRNTDLIIESIIETLRMAAFRPHDAVLAITCLGYLIKLSPRAKFLADDEDVTQAVRQANIVGKCSHALLEAESAKVEREIRGKYFRNIESSSLENIVF